MTLSPPFIISAAIIIVVAVGLFAAACRARVIFSFLLVLFYSFMSKLLSVLYLDSHQVFITESDSVSTASVSWVFFAASGLLMFLAAWCVFYLWGGKYSPSRIIYEPVKINSVQISLAKYAVILVLALHFLNFVLSQRIALPGSSVSRFDFWAGSVLPLDKVFGSLFLFFPLCCAGLGIAGIEMKSKSLVRFGVVSGFAYFFVLVLEGQRFHGLLLGGSVTVAMLLFAVYRYELSINWKKIGTIGIVIVLAGWILLLKDFGERGLSEYSGSASAAIVYRVFVLQGHTIWSAFQTYFHAGPTGDFANLWNGIGYIMNATGSASVIEGYAEKGVHFAAALPATLVLTGGIPLLAIGSILYGGIYALTALGIYRTVLKGRVLTGGLLMYFWLAIHSVYAKASLEPLLDLIPWIALGLYFFLNTVVVTIQKRF